MTVLIVLAIITILVVAWHHLAPVYFHWLKEEQLADLRAFVFSGAIVGVVSTQIQRYS